MGQNPKVDFSFQHFNMKNFKCTAKLKELYSEYPYTHYQESTIHILLQWLYVIIILLSTH